MTPSDLRAAGLLDSLDEELARGLCGIVGSDDPAVALAIALVSRHVQQGHTCFPLNARPEAIWPHEAERPDALPELHDWVAALERSGLTNEGPLVIDNRARLYLRRFWELEQGLARSIRSRAGSVRAASVSAGPDVEALTRLFGANESSAQRRAAKHALRYRISLLCGGPGTGKTTTVAAIVAWLAERALASGEGAPRVSLLAPTGKAAARLGEAVASAKTRLDASNEVLACIPDEASTVHRALGMRRGGVRFTRNADYPLDADVVVLDEASMIDLQLMRQLVDATPPDATLLIVGDPDQLTSVEAGSVLRDLVDASAETWWKGRVTRLEKTWRYDAAQPLGALIRAIREGDANTVDTLLDDEGAPGAQDVTWAPPDALPKELDRVAAFWRETLETLDPKTHFARRAHHVMLTPYRRGSSGTEALGQAIEARLHATGEAPRVAPILIEQNSADLQVFNGDFAMSIRGETPTAVVLDPQGEPRTIAEARLPRYTAAYALSVHKAQGSEFDEVLIVLPDEDAPILTRELLYTAVSRAKKRVRIVGPRELIRAALSRRARRDSGVVDAIANTTDDAAR